MRAHSPGRARPAEAMPKLGYRSGTSQAARPPDGLLLADLDPVGTSDQHRVPLRTQRGGLPIQPLDPPACPGRELRTCAARKMRPAMRARSTSFSPGRSPHVRWR